MRHILVMALVAVAVGACVSENQRLVAIRSCEAVGVTQSDPYFETCAQAYRLQANQDNLDAAYRLTLNPTYEKRGLGHQWHGF